MAAIPEEGFFRKFLPLLGYPTDNDSDKLLLSRNDLFIVPNKDAFQKVKLEHNYKVESKTFFSRQIVHFLFEKLDSSRSSSDFRDCWPILDKKMEADFRRVCFNWYKELQVSFNRFKILILSEIYVFSFSSRIQVSYRRSQLRSSKVLAEENSSTLSPVSSVLSLKSI